MNFDLDDRQNQLRKDVRHLMALEAEALRAIDPAQPPALYGAYRELIKKLGGMGYWENGENPGRREGAPYVDYGTSVLAGEELAGVFPDVYLAVEFHGRLAGGLLSRYGSADLISRTLDPLLRGDLLATAAFRESLGNFSGALLETRAEKWGGSYRLRGGKKGVINGPLADVFMVPAWVGEQPGLFLIPTGSDGLVKSEPYRLLGYERILLNDLTLEDVLVPAEDLMGPFDGPRILFECRTRENMAITVSALGVLHRTLADAKQYASEKPEGQKPPRAQQEIRYRLAEMFALYQTAQLFTYRAAWMLESGAPEASTVADAAKVFVTEAAEEAARGTMQITALDGYRAGNAFETAYRDARFGPSAGESSEVLRMRIADDCLRKYR